MKVQGTGRGGKAREYGGYIICASQCNLRCNAAEIYNCPFIARQHPDHEFEIKEFLLKLRGFEKSKKLVVMNSVEVKDYLWKTRND